MGDLAAFLHPRDFLVHGPADAVHDSDGVGAGLAQQRTVDTPFAVDSNDVVLDRGVVLRITDVANEDGTTVPHGDRHIVDIFGAGKSVEGMHLILGAAELQRATGKDQVRLAQGPHHVHRSQLQRVELLGVDVHHHLAELSSERVRDLNTLQTAHPVPHRVVADLVQFGFAQAFTRDGRQDHGQVRRFAPQGEGKLDARRQMEHIAGFEIDDVVHGGAGIGPGMKEDFDHARAWQRP